MHLRTDIITFYLTLYLSTSKGGFCGRSQTTTTEEEFIATVSSSTIDGFEPLRSKNISQSLKVLDIYTTYCSQTVAVCRYSGRYTNFFHKILVYAKSQLKTNKPKNRVYKTRYRFLQTNSSHV